MTLTVNEGGGGGGLLFQKLLSYTKFYLLACTMYGHKDKRTRRKNASQDFV